jgi:DNA ligase 1
MLQSPLGQHQQRGISNIGVHALPFSASIHVIVKSGKLILRYKKNMEKLVKNKFGSVIRNMVRRGDGIISREDAAQLKRDVERASGLTAGTLDAQGVARDVFVATLVHVLQGSPSKSPESVVNSPTSSTSGQRPQAMLAHGYDVKKHKGRRYYVSEKLDGIRAMFLDGQLYTRGGKVIRAPAWFLKAIPPGTHDGELFGGRGSFQTTSSIVMGPSTNPLWNTITYKIFDDWSSTDPFSKTYDRLSKVLPQCSSSKKHSVCLEPQTVIDNNASIQRLLDEITSRGGEGLMLRSNVPYKPGVRSNALLKVKKMQDAEARVVGFDMDGDTIKSLVCTWMNPGFDRSVKFKVGSGLTQTQRRRGAFKIGDVITVQYFELTSSGKPRFPVFKGVRRNL